MWHVVAASAPAPVVSDQLIVVVGGVITAAIVALGGVLVAVVNSRNKQTTPSPPSPTGVGDQHVLYERTAVLSRRADDADERFHVMDKAQTQTRDDLDDVLDYLDERKPGWRD